MRCKHCHEQLALELGGDLDAREQTAVQRHLAQCPECREYRRKLQQSQAALQTAAEAPSPQQPSLWPGLARLIQPIAQTPVVVRRTANHFNGWIPALAVGVACLLVLSFSGQQGRRMMKEPGVQFQPVQTSPVYHEKESDREQEPGIHQIPWEIHQATPRHDPGMNLWRENRFPTD